LLGLLYFRPVILIADSGSTKTDWVLVSDQGEEERFQSMGLNPFFVKSETVSEALSEELPKSALNATSDIWFYGAGCSSDARNAIISEGLSKVLPGARPWVAHDLIGAARALFHNDPGIACILGTGSNTSFYDGTDIVKNVPALGYVLGDDGSGAHLGKELVRSYLYGELSQEVVNTIEGDYGLDKETIFRRVYNENLANRFLASLAPICKQHLEDDSVHHLVSHAFDVFVERLLKKYSDYKQYPVGIIGSIGLAFEELIRNKMADEGFQLSRTMKKPIDALVKYHRELS